MEATSSRTASSSFTTRMRSELGVLGISIPRASVLSSFVPASRLVCGMAAFGKDGAAGCRDNPNVSRGVLPRLSGGDTDHALIGGFLPGGRYMLLLSRG